jgi:hypothetical protein
LSASKTGDFDFGALALVAFGLVAEGLAAGPFAMEVFETLAFAVVALAAVAFATAALGFAVFATAVFEAGFVEVGFFESVTSAAGVLRVDVLPVFGDTDLDNTDVVRDHSFHCIANAESRHALILGIWCYGFKN